jgi:hypothetical protein
MKAGRWMRKARSRTMSHDRAATRSVRCDFGGNYPPPPRCFGRCSRTPSPNTVARHRKRYGTFGASGTVKLPFTPPEPYGGSRPRHEPASMAERRTKSFRMNNGDKQTFVLGSGRWLKRRLRILGRRYPHPLLAVPRSLRPSSVSNATTFAKPVVVRGEAVAPPAPLSHRAPRRAMSPKRAQPAPAASVRR